VSWLPKTCIGFAGAAALLAAAPGLANPVDSGPGPLVPKAPQSAPPSQPELPADSTTARVVLRCIVMVDATVDKCQVARETPTGHGLGDAALRMAHQIKISPENFSKDIVGEVVDIPLSFTRDEEVADMPPPARP
jgi:hypothetical protein